MPRRGLLSATARILAGSVKVEGQCGVVSDHCLVQDGGCRRGGEIRWLVLLIFECNPIDAVYTAQSTDMRSLLRNVYVMAWTAKRLNRFEGIANLEHHLVPNRDMEPVRGPPYPYSLAPGCGGV